MLPWYCSACCSNNSRSRLYEEDETEGQEEPMVPGPALDLNVLECQGETELPSVSHRGPDGFKKAPENDGEGPESMVAVRGSHAQKA